MRLAFQLQSTSTLSWCTSLLNNQHGVNVSFFAASRDGACLLYSAPCGLAPSARLLSRKLSGHNVGLPKFPPLLQLFRRRSKQTAILYDGRFYEYCGVYLDRKEGNEQSLTFYRTIRGPQQPNTNAASSSSAASSQFSSSYTFTLSRHSLRNLQHPSYHYHLSTHQSTPQHLPLPPTPPS